MRKYYEENRQKLYILSILFFFVLVLGVVTGSVFYTKTADGGAAVSERFSDIFRVMSETQDKRGIALKMFFEGLVMCGLIFAGAYFKAGALLSAAVVLRKGFITGFAAAAAAGAYGLKGALVMCATGAELVPGIMTLVPFAAVSASYALSAEKKSKKFLIFFLIFSISIFCAISFSRGFVATTFMKFLYPKIA